MSRVTLQTKHASSGNLSLKLYRFTGGSPPKVPDAEDSSRCVGSPSTPGASHRAVVAAWVISICFLLIHKDGAYYWRHLSFTATSVRNTINAVTRNHPC